MRHHRKMFAAAIAVALLGGATTAADADGWIASWGASDVFPIGQEINYQTLRQIVRLSAGGKQVRVRFSNEPAFIRWSSAPPMSRSERPTRPWGQSTPLPITRSPSEGWAG